MSMFVQPIYCSRHDTAIGCHRDTQLEREGFPRTIPAIRNGVYLSK